MRKLFNLSSLTAALIVPTVGIIVAALIAFDISLSFSPDDVPWWWTDQQPEIKTDPLPIPPVPTEPGCTLMPNGVLVCERISDGKGTTP